MMKPIQSEMCVEALHNWTFLRIINDYHLFGHSVECARLAQALVRVVCQSEFEW